MLPKNWASTAEPTSGSSEAEGLEAGGPERSGTTARHRDQALHALAGGSRRCVRLWRIGSVPQSHWSSQRALVASPLPQTESFVSTSSPGPDNPRSAQFRKTVQMKMPLIGRSTLYKRAYQTASPKTHGYYRSVQGIGGRVNALFRILGRFRPEAAILYLHYQGAFELDSKFGCVDSPMIITFELAAQELDLWPRSFPHPKKPCADASAYGAPATGRVPQA